MERPGAYPRWKHLKVAPIGFALALPSNSKTCLERVSTDKCSSSLGLIVSDEGHFLKTLTPGNPLGARPEKHEDDVVEDLEDGDEAAAHGEAEDTADVGNEPDDRNFLEKKVFFTINS